MPRADDINKILKNTDAQNLPVGTVYNNYTDYIKGSQIHRLFRDDDGVWHPYCAPGVEATYNYMGKKIAITCVKCSWLKEPRVQ